MKIRLTTRSNVAVSHLHMLMTGRSEWFFGVWNFGKSDFLEDAGIVLGREEKQRDFFGLRKEDWGIFLGMLKQVVIFLGRQILKLWFFWL